MIRMGQLSEESLARQLFTASSIKERDGAVPADAWLENENLASDARIWEESLFMPNYKSTITILTIHRETK